MVATASSAKREARDWKRWNDGRKDGDGDRHVMVGRECEIKNSTKEGRVSIFLTISLPFFMFWLSCCMVRRYQHERKHTIRSK